MKNTYLVLASAILAASAIKTAPAAVIAIVDSGTDITHPELVSKIWDNTGEVDDGVDNDNNGYIDDLHGWDFAGNDDRLIDKSLIGTFPQDDYTYFEYQTNYLEGTATADQIAWLKAKVADDKFVANLERFGDFVHGTHVAGCAAKGADQARLMILKLIATPAAPSFFAGVPSTHAIGGTKDAIIKAGLNALAEAQGKALAPVGQYIKMEHAQIASCSFGTGRAEIEPTISKLVGMLKITLTQDELDAYSNYFIIQTNAAMQKQFIGVAPDAMFVIAAGNDGTDNDTISSAPANVKAENTITVAATLGVSSLAKFSNFGATMVDIAAPGVGIRSTVPGGGYMQISGTSQATPYVTNIVGQVMDANPKLSLAEVKKLVFGTVDKKDWLAGKVVTGGIANPDRALFAAKLTMSGSDLDSAIAQARTHVADIAPTQSELAVQTHASEVQALRMPSFIQE
jgi:subtilisin family serine protease